MELVVTVVTAAIILLIVKLRFRSKVSNLFRLYAKGVEIEGKPVNAYSAPKGETQIMVETPSNLQKSSPCFRMRIKARAGAPSRIRWDRSRMTFPNGGSCAIAGYSLDDPAPCAVLKDDEWTDLIVCLGTGTAADILSSGLASFDAFLRFPKEGREEVVVSLMADLAGGESATEVRILMEALRVEAEKEVKYFDHQKAINILRTLRSVRT
jgi:hypothetical protein